MMKYALMLRLGVLPVLLGPLASSTYGDDRPNLVFLLTDDQSTS